MNAAPRKPEKAPKGPSKFFTEYYGSVFLFLLAGFIVLAYVVLIPMIREIRSINAQTESRIAAIEDERRYLSSLEQSVAAAQSIPAATLEQVGEALPNEAKFPSLLLQFGAASARNNVRIDSVSFLETRATPGAQAGRATSTSPVTPTDVNLALRARSYFDVKRFLADIEANLRLMDVVSLTSSMSSGELTYNLQLRAYTFTAALPRTAAAQP